MDMRICASSHILDAMRELVRACKAISAETRLRILNIVMVRECSVSEVMQALQISQTRASRNLGALYDAGLLSSRRDGAWVLYSIDEEGLDGHSRELLGALRSMLAKDRVARQDVARLGLAKRSDP
ncbi:MAG: winged helix-turn-helix transcriptional regulator [Chloroflexi bacterium]|nr:winged helix-turn-helix transcriptional regulator [Chloroflexota bacterium]